MTLGLGWCLRECELQDLLSMSAGIGPLPPQPSSWATFWVGLPAQWVLRAGLPAHSWGLAHTEATDGRSEVRAGRKETRTACWRTHLKLQQISFLCHTLLSALGRSQLGLIPGESAGALI